MLLEYLSVVVVVVSYTSDIHNYQIKNVNHFFIDFCKNAKKYNSVFYKGLTDLNLKV